MEVIDVSGLKLLDKRYSYMSKNLDKLREELEAFGYKPEFAFVTADSPSVANKRLYLKTNRSQLVMSFGEAKIYGESLDKSLEKLIEQEYKHAISLEDKANRVAVTTFPIAFILYVLYKVFTNQP